MVKLPYLDAVDEEVVFSKRPQVESQAFLHPTPVQVTIDVDAELAIGGADYDTVCPALKKVVVSSAPVEQVKAAKALLSVEGEQPRLAGADKGLCQLRRAYFCALCRDYLDKYTTPRQFHRR